MFCNDPSLPIKKVKVKNNKRKKNKQKRQIKIAHYYQSEIPQVKYPKKYPQNTNNKNYKMAEPWMCARQQLLEIRGAGYLLVFLHFAKVGLDGRCYENRSTFYGGGARGQWKTLIFKISIFDSLKLGWWLLDFLKVLCQKNPDFYRKNMNMDSTF